MSDRPDWTDAKGRQYFNVERIQCSVCREEFTIPKGSRDPADGGWVCDNCESQARLAGRNGP